MKIYYIGNQTAGLISRLTVKALGHEIVDTIAGCDILLNVHGRKIIPKETLQLPKIASINVHPYLYTYKGANPIQRAINEGNYHASVGCHHMTEKIDEGKVICERFIDLEPTFCCAELYNQIYDLYYEVIKESLNILEQEYIFDSKEPDI